MGAGSPVKPVGLIDRSLLKMNSLICPVSPLRVEANTVRLTALLISAFVAAYLISNSIYFILFICIDFSIRAFTEIKFSPLSWLASTTRRALKLPDNKIDKAPKIFAARVGLIFSLSIIILYVVGLFKTAAAVALVLLFFAMLESFLNFCFGCVVYSYIVLPWYRKNK